MTCKNCIFSQQHRQANEIKAQVVCKRFPPHPHLIQQHGGVGVLPVFPPVHEDDWCGEYTEPETGQGVQILPILGSSKS